MRGARRVGSIHPAVIVLLLLVTVREGVAGYPALRREMEGYHPPAEVGAAMTAPPLPATKGAPPAADGFQDQVAALRKRQGEFVKELTAPPAASSFLSLDPRLFDPLRPAAEDAAVAAKALAGTFSLTTLEALVLLRSPTVQAKESEFRAVLEGYSQVEDLDTILRRYAALTKGVMTGVGGMTNPDPVAFKFPFPGVLALKGEVVGQEAAAAREELEKARREAVTAIRQLHAELLYLHQALALTSSQQQLLTNLHGAIATRYEAGSTTFQDLTTIAIEREKVGEELTTLVEERKNGEAAIRAALLLPEEVVIGVPLPGQSVGKPLSLAELYPEAIARRQELRAQRAMVGRMERLLELAETMVYPGFSQGLSLYEGDEVSRVQGSGLQSEGEQKAMAGGGGSFPEGIAAGTGIGLPKMPWYGSDEAYLRQTRERIAALKKELAAITAATTLGVRTAWFKVDKARREESLYRERVIPLAKANLDSASEGYAAGMVGFTDLIEATGGWLTANLARARAEADLLVAQAELDAAVGRTLQEP